jgi:hypothetical protein
VADSSIGLVLGLCGRCRRIGVRFKIRYSIQQPHIRFITDTTPSVRRLVAESFVLPPIWRKPYVESARSATSDTVRVISVVRSRSRFWGLLRRCDRAILSPPLFGHTARVTAPSPRGATLRIGCWQRAWLWSCTVTASPSFVVCRHRSPRSLTPGRLASRI